MATLKKRFFLKLLLILPMRKLATKRETCLSQTRSLKPKFPQSCTTSRSAHHDDQIDTVRIPSQKKHTIC